MTEFARGFYCGISAAIKAVDLSLVDLILTCKSDQKKMMSMSIAGAMVSAMKKAQATIIALDYDEPPSCPWCNLQFDNWSFAKLHVKKCAKAPNSRRRI